MQVKSVSLQEAKNYVEKLNLNYIVEAMCAEHYSLPRWVRLEAEQCCSLYKNFLWLNKKFLPLELVPTREIDEFWHNHILYTREYVKDCYHIFGHYFHHEPASPLGDQEKLITNFQQTEKLYLEEFKAPLVLLKND